MFKKKKNLFQISSTDKGVDLIYLKIFSISQIFDAHALYITFRIVNTFIYPFDIPFPSDYFKKVLFEMSLNESHLNTTRNDF